jgi:hypothetical protein
LIKTNPALYERAREYIQSGRWRIDADAGHVIGQRGRPMRRRNPDGYIQVKFGMNEPAVFAHRVIWEHVNGTIPDGMTINHRNGIKTDNRIVNLELSTVRDNIHHAVANGLRAAPIRGEDAKLHRLTAAQASDIYRRCQTERVCDLAREHGVAYWTVSDIKHGRSWTHVTQHESA